MLLTQTWLSSLSVGAHTIDVLSAVDWCRSAVWRPHISTLLADHTMSVVPIRQVFFYCLLALFSGSIIRVRLKHTTHRRHQDFWVRGRAARGQGGGHRGQKKIVVIGLSTDENWQQVLWPLTTGNKKKLNIDYAVFWHISWIFDIKFTLRQWMVRDERMHIILLSFFVVHARWAFFVDRHHHMLSGSSFFSLMLVVSGNLNWITIVICRTSRYLMASVTLSNTLLCPGLVWHLWRDSAKIVGRIFAKFGELIDWNADDMNLLDFWVA